MLVLMWMALLYCAEGTSSFRIKHCQVGSFCIILTEGEITAEAGLCLVIPCSFTTDDAYNVTSVIWYKCASDKQHICDESGNDQIINSNNTQEVHSEFRGRVSLLEPDPSLKNCSIIISDLKKSDSGSYQLRLVAVYRGKPDGFTFVSKASISVTGLNQKPTVMIPPLIKGHQATLTCTAPGLCSGSVPEITWTWRGAGVKDSHITGNITDFKTENLTAFTQRHSSTLTFDPSAELYGTEVTCKVRFTGNMTTEETVTLNESFLPKILNTSACVVQLEVLTCVCISEGRPLPAIKWLLLDDHSEYSVTTTASNHTVTSNISLSVENNTTTAVECVSTNANGEVLQNLTIGPSERALHLGLIGMIFLIIAVVSLILNVIFIIYCVFLWNSLKKMEPKQEDIARSEKTDNLSVYENVLRPRRNKM